VLGFARRLRNNKEAWLGVAQDSVVDRVERRIARYTMLPADNGEPLHVMQYQAGQGYGARPSETLHAGQRQHAHCLYNISAHPCRTCIRQL
jgi:hypothetical protein